MASTESTIRIVFDGVSRGVAAAAAQARAAIAGLESQTRTIQRSFDGLGNSVDNFNLRFGAAFQQLNRTLLPVNRGFRTLTLSVAALSLASAATVGGMQLIAGTVGALTQLAPAALLLPGALLAAGAAMGTFKLATLGVGDALKAGLTGDMAKFAEATKDMAPAMQDALKAVVAFKPQIDDLRKSVQGDFWAGFSSEITNLGNRYLPILRTGLSDIARQFNGMAIEASRAAQTPFFTNAVTSILARTSQALANMRPALANILTGFVGLGEVGARFLPRLGTAITDLTAKFRTWVEQNSEVGGSIERLIASAIQGFKDLAAIVGNIGSIITSVFTGMGFSFASPLAALRDLTTQAAEFLRTVEAQEGLAQLGAALREIGAQTGRVFMALLQELLPILRESGPAIVAFAQGVGDFLVAAIRTVGPLIRELGTFLSENKDLIRELTPFVLALAVAVKGLIVFTQVAKWVATARSAFVLLKGAFDGIGAAAGLAKGRVGVFGGALRALKVVGIGGALAAVAVGMDEINVAAKGGAENLTGWDENLHDIAGALKQIFTGAFPAIIADITTELDELNKKWSDGKAPVQEWFAAVKESFQRDFVDVFAAIPGQIGTFFVNLGTTISTNASTAWELFKTTTKTKLDEAVTFVSELPGRIATAIGDFGTFLATKASEAWEAFKAAAVAKFDAIVGDVETLPFRIGFAIGTLIGAAAKWAIDTWQAFKDAAIAKYNEIVADVQALPGRIGGAIAGLVTELGNRARDSWESFKASARAKGEEILADVRAFPGKVGAAIAGLVAELGRKATEAWEAFKRTAAAKGNEILADARALPGKIAAAIANLAGELGRKATEAWESFKRSAAAKINEILAEVRALPGKITGALGNMGNLLVGAGRALMDGLLAGIKAAYQSVLNFVRGIAAGLAAAKGPLPYDAVVMIPAGKALMAGLQTGIEQGYAGVLSYVGGLAPGLANALSTSVTPQLAMSGLSASAPNPNSHALQQLLSLQSSDTPIQVTVLLDGQPVRDIARTEIAATSRTTRRTVVSGAGTTY
jgi:phage-related protein